MNRETAYDEVFDAQRHFRSVLDSMSRPGKVNRLTGLSLNPPPSLNKAAAAVVFSLLNADVSFHLASFDDATVAYLEANTASRVKPVDQADYIVLNGTGDEAPIHTAKLGLPAYPETGSTAIIQVGHAGKTSAIGGLQLTLEGPGIETREIVFVTGLRPELLAALKAKNTEFPLGVDAILVTADESVLCLPRTTRLVWNTL
jgi:alpha-D-ribose 1-methylphosphonate 5-triphosphate synthase subunit PhnH